VNLTRTVVRRRALVALAAAAIVAAGCSSSSAEPAASAATATVATAAVTEATTADTTADTAASDTTAPGATVAETAPADTQPVSTEAPSTDAPSSDSTLPPGATPGLDDYDGDGQPDPTCGTQDFGAGLELRIPCTISSAHQPADDTPLVDGSLFRLPGNNPEGFDGVSADVLEARDVAGAKVLIIIFNTDGLFAKNKATIDEPQTMTNTVTGINKFWPGSAIQVRGHTDATGSAATNQTLSEQRAATVATFLQAHGVQASEVTAVGLSSSQPLSLETNPDGTPNPEGQKFNRRVELVLRLPS
jgi:outer membrane protein OmpA-like peptidoglycan-associated protein